MKLPFIKLPKQAEKRNPIIGVLVGLVFVCVFGVITSDMATKSRFTSWAHTLVESLENNTYDLRFRLRGALDQKQISRDIVLLDYDDETLAWAPFPPDRSYYAEIVKALGSSGANARATFFDIFFFDPFGRHLSESGVEAFRQKLAELQKQIAADQTITDGMKAKMFDASEKLKAAGSVGEASKLIDEIDADPKLQSDIGYFSEFRDYLKANANLDELAPDLDIILHDNMAAAGNVYLGQIVDDWLTTKYTVDTVLYNPEVHKVFGQLIVLADRTKTKTKMEFDVNTALTNFMAMDFKQLLDESGKTSSGGRKALPFNKEELAAIKQEMVKLDNEKAQALALNEKFGWDVGKGAPASVADLKKSYKLIRRIAPLNASIVDKASGLAYVKPDLQADGVIRMISPVSFYENRMYPHISLMLAMKYFGITKNDVVFFRDKVELRNCTFPGRKDKQTVTIPLYKNRYILVNWAGTFYEPNTFEHRSFKRIYEAALKYNILKKQQRGEPLKDAEQQILASMAPADKDKAVKEIEFFKGKVAMTGMTAADTHDLNPIPLSPRYPLVGMHANLVNMIIKGLFIRSVPFGVFLLLLLVMGVAMGYIGGTAKQVPGALATVGMILVYGLICALLFRFGRIWLEFVPVVFMLVLIYLMVLIYRFMTEGQEAKKMKGMFATYVNPSVVDTLIQNPEMLRLGGERMDLTAMFALAWGPGLDSDSAEIVVERLNEYFTSMTDQIFKYDGTLDKYEGHIIMAIYGAPVHFTDHAAKACMSCADMKKALAELWVKWKSEGKEPIYTTVGLNSGPMIAGNMGSASRFNYTIMGDSVNVSARILGAGKQYGVDYLISEKTYNSAKDAVVTRLVDDIVVVGKVEPVKVYQILGKVGESLDDVTAKLKEFYEKGFALYTQRKWDEAIEMFNTVLKHKEDDKPSKLLIARCEQYKQSPPAEAWKGEFVLTAKGM